jgi:Ino eighty subunit 2
VKMPANRLREATGSGRAARRSVNVFREDPIVSGPRSSRNRKKIVEVATSDEEEIGDQEEDEVDDEDAPGDDDDEDDADGDVDMDETPPQPPVRRGKAAPAPRAKPPKSVEAKEMELDEDEEEDEEDEEEEQMSDSDEDAEGEVEDQDESGVPDVTVDDMDELDDDLIDEELEGEFLDGGKMTKRQRGNLGNDFLQLPMEPQVKKHLTAEERQMRRAEMARRRKNLSEKRNEEEKMDTINRLLKKQAPKRRGRAAANEAADGTPAGQDVSEPEKADPIFVRWVSGPSGCKVNVPEEWLGTPSGRMFGAPPADPAGKMVGEH